MSWRMWLSFAGVALSAFLVVFLEERWLRGIMLVAFSAGADSWRCAVRLAHGDRWYGR